MQKLRLTTAPLPYQKPVDALARIASITKEELTLLHTGNMGGGGQSVLALTPLATLTVPDNFTIHPVDQLQQLIDAYDFETPHPLIGWLTTLSYDLAHTLEHIPAHAKDDLNLPLLHATLFTHYLLFDNAHRTLTLHTLHTENETPPPLPTAISNALTAPIPTPPDPHLSTLLQEQSQQQFTTAVQQVKDYIAAGDIYQANLSQRWTIETPDQPHDIFRRLCDRSPAPYAAFYRFNNIHLLSASPELFLAVDNRDIITRPIKGTRPRAPQDPLEDARLREELLASPKDHAELAMIVDLLRNDLGRVCDFGSVHVIEPRTLEPHPTVWHTVSTIRGTLRKDTTLADLLRATLPGGSITGAPKIRATQIIEELEPVRRHFYCGHLGVIGPQAKTLAFNIAIRTMTLLPAPDSPGYHAYVHAGAGIVADSEPFNEYEETLHKARAMLAALGITDLDTTRLTG